MRGLTASLCAVAFVVMCAAAPSAFAAKGGEPGPPSKDKSAERICEKRGGVFVNVSPLLRLRVPGPQTPGPQSGEEDLPAAGGPVRRREPARLRLCAPGRDIAESVPVVALAEAATGNDSGRE